MTALTTVDQADTRVRYSDADLARIKRWQDTNDRARDLYWARRRLPWKNRGPFGCKHAWSALPDRSTWHVVHDVPVAGGTVLPDGLIVPQVGATLCNVQLAPACHSSRQARKLLKRIQRRIPDAHVVRFVRTMPEKSDGTMTSDRHVRIGSIQANDGAPADWWNVRVTAGGSNEVSQ